MSDTPVPTAGKTGSEISKGRPVKIRADNLTMSYGDRIIQSHLSFSVYQGDRFIIMGDSGCGKSTLLKHLIALYQPAAGRIFYGERELWAMSDDERLALAQQFGVLYQSGALFSSMTLAENIALPITQYSSLPAADVEQLVELKLSLVGLAGFGGYLPSEISGGMKKRAALARAMALDPDILFLDEPSAGLDPLSSRLLDELIIELNESLGTTFLIVTHELASIFAVGHRALFLDSTSRTMLALGAPADLLERCPNEKVRRFLNRGIARPLEATP